MDLGSLPNPYDFANPVSDKVLFVGRAEELKEITYYLDHARAAPRPINIAILGPRASGKTSLLNITELEAKARSFCTVRIDLDEGDANTQLGFFHKLFDGVLTAASDLGAFGGRDGKTYDIYLDLVNSYKIPEKNLFCPFSFPVQYAKAMGAGNPNAQLSDSIFKSDLGKLRTEVGRPIVILFDEGNVLAKSRIHLEKLRNIFMNTPGFMLILTGTPDLFPVMDDVFSPIVRQFKKVTLGRFVSPFETEACVKKPLEKLGIDPEEVFDFRDFRQIFEIHELAGGRPYEIQLICHVMFRRLQTKQAKAMRLDLGVLEDVRRELETSQDVTIRPVLTAVRSLEIPHLRALNLLSACDGRATFEQIWSVEFIVRDEEVWTEEALRRGLRELVDRGILLESDGILRFAGDDFDKIYTKYFAREQKVTVGFPDFPLEIFWLFKSMPRFEAEQLSPLSSYIRPGLDVDVDLVALASKLASQDPSEDVFVESPPQVRDLYRVMVSRRSQATVTFLSVEIMMPWLRAKSWWYSSNPQDLSVVGRSVQKIDALSERARAMGGDLTSSTVEVAIIPVEELVGKVQRSGNERFRKTLAADHAEQSFNEHVQKRNLGEALFHAQLSYRYDPSPEPQTVANNLGYIFLGAGELHIARELLQSIVGKAESPRDDALYHYNLGLVEAMLNNAREGLDLIDACIRQARASSDEETHYLCLYLPKLAGGIVTLEEVRDEPDLREIAEQARQNLSSYFESR